LGENITGDVSSILKQAEIARESGNGDEALYLYVTALNRDPNNVEALVNIGRIHRRNRNDKLSELAYQLALKNSPNNIDALEGMGLLELNRKADKEAAILLEKVVSLDQRRWEAINGLGILADRAGNHAVAMTHFQRAVAIRPNSPELLNNIGYSKYLAGDLSGALRDYDLILANDAKNKQASMNKALVLAQQGRDAQALAVLQQVMSLADAYNHLGYNYMQNGDIDMAHDYFEKAIATSPGYHKQANENMKNLNMLAR
jgi:Flp pilus assembly protein TadD